MWLVDSHCHLDPENLREPVDAVLERARGVGVGAFVGVGVGADGTAAQAAVDLAQKRPDVWAVVGIHPHDASALTEPHWAEISRLAKQPRVVAVGEIGLDYHYDFSPRQAQQEVFRRMVGLARELHKPIVVHTREAAVDTLTILEQEGARDVGGIIHCFTEDVRFAKAALDLGFDLSFSGILTFKNADRIREAALYAPPDRILVETDSPYLSPAPVRGKRCEPAFVAHTARALAVLRGTTLDALAAQTTENAVRRLTLELP